LKTPPEQGVIAVTSFLLAITLLLMIVLVFFRNSPQIKSSSFIFCEIIMFGAACVYASMYFWVIFTNTPLCNINVWLFILGMDICLGALLAKNVRLFYIFKNAMKLRKVKPIKNWHLLLMIFAVMFIDAIVIIIWQAAFPIYAIRISPDVSRRSQDYLLCGSQVLADPSVTASDKVQTAFFATLGALKAILLIIAVVLSILVRKQPSEFNESRTIALSIYNISFCLVCILAIWLAIPDNSYTLKYILRSFIVLWGNTITLVCIFGRKFYYIAIGKNKAYKGRGSTSSRGSAFQSREQSSTNKATTGSSS